MYFVTDKNCFLKHYPVYNFDRLSLLQYSLLFFSVHLRPQIFGGPKLRLVKRGFASRWALWLDSCCVSGVGGSAWCLVGGVLSLSCPGQRVFIALQPGARDLQAKQPGRINLSTPLSRRELERSGLVGEDQRRYEAAAAALGGSCYREVGAGTGNPWMRSANC